MAQPSQSEWALKYGTANPGDVHSNYTPLALNFPSLGASTQSFLDVPAIEAFQRRKLKGFTSTELARLDCLPTRELKPGNLQNGIMPLFEREFWEVTPFKPDFTRNHLYALKNGNGVWTASNDAVWTIMQPSLLLASRTLMSVHLLPWFDALLFGERIEVPEHRIKEEDKCDEHGDKIDLVELETFWQRSSEEFEPASVASQRDLILLKLQQEFDYRFGFMNSDIEHPLGPEEDAEDAYAYAITFTNRSHMQLDEHIPGRRWRVYTFLDLNEPEKLFRTDLNSAERMQIEWQIATTLVHEVMHAIGFLSSDLNDKPDRHEIYFELQAIAELGFSYEHAMNLGQTEEMIQSDHPNHVPPLGFWFRKHWPDVTDVEEGSQGQPVLQDPGLATTNDTYPIPLTFYQDMQQEEFWAVAVMNYGTSLLQYRCVKEGTRTKYRASKHKRGKYKIRSQKRISLPDHPFQVLNDAFCASISALTSTLDMTPQERKAMLFGKSFLMSSKLEERFWTDSHSQKEQVDNMNEAIAQSETAPQTPNSRRELSSALLDFAIAAIDNHECLVEGIMSMETLNKTTYTDRRLALREWNRGTRVFLRRLNDALVHFLLTAENELLALERARMLLWSPAAEGEGQEEATPSSTQNATARFDQREMRTIEHVIRLTIPADNVLIRTLSEEILDAPEVSLVGECFARVVLFELDKAFVDGWDARYETVRLAGRRLEYLVPAAGEGWETLMSDLKGACEAALRRSRPVVPPGGGDANVAS